MNKKVISELAQQGLQIDGAHHKQWYLAEILLAAIGEEEYNKITEALSIWNDLGTPP